MEARGLACRSGAFLYLLLSFLVFLLATSPDSALSEVAGGFVLGAGLFVAFLMAWYAVLAFLGAALALGALVAGVARLLGVQVGLRDAAGAAAVFTAGLAAAYHLWVNGRALRGASRRARGALRAVLAASGACYTLLALAVAGVLAALAASPLLARLAPGREGALSDAELDAIVAVVLLLVAAAKTGTGALGLAGGGRGRAWGALHLAGAASAAMLAYYLLGPLAHLPLAPTAPVVVENIEAYRLPIVLLSIFALTGLAAWATASPDC